MRSQRTDLVWKALAILGGAAAGVATTRVVGMVWKKVTDTEAPLNRAPGATTRRSEILWVIASGLAVALVRLVARRGMARLWRAKTGQYPQPLVDSSAAVS